jgi:hypothetical protein
MNLDFLHVLTEKVILLSFPVCRASRFGIMKIPMEDGLGDSQEKRAAWPRGFTLMFHKNRK